MKPSLLVMALATFLFAPIASPSRAAEGSPPPAKATGHAAGASGGSPSAGAKAGAKKGEVTLTGQLTCAKCGLKEASVCQNVLRVSDAGAKTETKYYLAKNDVAEAHHEQVCGGQVAATVTGRVTEQAGKKILTASAITLN